MHTVPLIVSASVSLTGRAFVLCTLLRGISVQQSLPSEQASDLQYRAITLYKARNDDEGSSAPLYPALGLDCRPGPLAPTAMTAAHGMLYIGVPA
jgi:hypothetical protein